MSILKKENPKVTMTVVTVIPELTSAPGPNRSVISPMSPFEVQMVRAVGGLLICRRDDHNTIISTRYTIYIAIKNGDFP
jgi:hypothetical protein